MGANRSGVRRVAKLKQTKKYQERLAKKAAASEAGEKGKVAAKR
jgi:hypothetical protein